MLNKNKQIVYYIKHLAIRPRIKIQSDSGKSDYLRKMQLSIADTKIIRRYFEKRPVRRVYIFGSYARATAVQATSDIDILVELDHREPIGMKFFGYQVDLEELLKKKVDLVTTEGMTKYIRIED